MKLNLKKGFKRFDPRTRKMRKASMAEAYHITATIILRPTFFSGDKATRVDEKGNSISRQAMRDWRHAHPKAAKGPNLHTKGRRQNATDGQGRSGCGAARQHLEAIGLGMAYSTPGLKEWKNRYRGGSWNK